MRNEKQQLQGSLRVAQLEIKDWRNSLMLQVYVRRVRQGFASSFFLFFFFSFFLFFFFSFFFFYIRWKGEDEREFTLSIPQIQS